MLQKLWGIILVHLSMLFIIEMPKCSIWTWTCHGYNPVWLTVVFSSEDLRCNVVGCPTEGTSGITWSDSLLSGRRREWSAKVNPTVATWIKDSVDDMICEKTVDGGPVGTSSQHLSTALLITLQQYQLLPCTCRSLWALCVPRGPREHCPASSHGRWCPFHEGSLERYRFQQHKICTGERSAEVYLSKSTVQRNPPYYCLIWIFQIICSNTRNWYKGCKDAKSPACSFSLTLSPIVTTIWCTVCR